MCIYPTVAVHEEAGWVPLGGAVTVTVVVAGGGPPPPAAARMAREEKTATLAKIIVL